MLPYAQWSRDPVDVAWYILRRIIELADRRSDFKATGRVTVEEGRILFTFEAYRYRSQFYIATEVLTDTFLGPVDGLVEEYGVKICKELHRHLTNQNNQVMDELGALIQQEERLFGIRNALKIADESKRSFVVGKAFPEANLIYFSCEEDLTKPLEDYGEIRWVGGSWRMRVDGRYDFESILEVLRAIEMANDCLLLTASTINRLLRAVWL